MENIIIQKVKPLDMGHALNHIQDAAEQVLSESHWMRYLRASNRDYNACEGMDGILLNGEYFDWKVFETQKDDIVRAFLRYFDDSDIALIANAL